MLIIFITTALILLTAYLLMIIFYKNSDKKIIYEFSTGPAKLFVVLSNIFFWLSFIIISLEIVIYFFTRNEFALWIVYGIFAFVAILGLLMLYDNLFNYEAIKSNDLYVHRFFTTKTISISEIRQVDIEGLGLVFLDKDGNKLMGISIETPGIDTFLSLINERKKGEIINLDIFVRTPEDDDEEAITQYESKVNDVLSQIGQDYRKEYPNNRIKFKIISILLAVIGIPALSITLLLLGRDIISVLTITLLLTTVALITIPLNISKMDKELKNDDIWLGNKYYFQNKMVVGSNRRKFKSTRNFCIFIIVFGVFFAIITTVASLQQPTVIDDFIPITGKLEYYQRTSGKNEYLAIALEGMATEYRLSSVYVDGFDDSFFDEVKKGDIITIYLNDLNEKEFHSNSTDRKKWANFYMLTTETKEYFSYEDYINEFNNNIKMAFIMMVGSIAFIIGAIVAMPISYKLYKKRVREEHLSL
ncbi:MAG: hypothetical protein J1F36_02830 [Clostridiales bacterium]|nr:hypothetical protein [Clostridiales bacterium]